MLETRLELLANLRELSGCLPVLQGYVQVTGEYLCLKERTHTQYTVIFYHLQSAIRGAQIRGWTVFWCFLLADLSVGVHTAARAPFCPLFFAGIRGQPAGRRPQLTGEVVHEDVPVNRTEHLITLKSNISFFIEALDEFLTKQVKSLITEIVLKISILS